jgi:hypothetical protein
MIDRNFDSFFCIKLVLQQYYRNFFIVKTDKTISCPKTTHILCAIENSPKTQPHIALSRLKKPFVK